MSLKAGLGNLRTNLKVRKEITNAEASTQVQSVKTHGRAMIMPVALAFVFMLASLATPVSAAIDLNATIGPILESIIALIPSIIGLIVAIVPAVIVMAVVGFIVAFFDKILGMLKF